MTPRSARSITNSDLLHLLGNASQLKKLTLWRSSLLSKRGLTHLLKKCPNLVELRVGGSWFGAKEEGEFVLQGGAEATTERARAGNRDV